MVPFSLLVGLATGVAAHDRHTLRLALWVGVAASSVFAIAVGVTSAPVHGIAAFGLAFVNHLVGLCFGSGVRCSAELLARGIRRTVAAVAS